MRRILPLLLVLLAACGHQPQAEPRLEDAWIAAGPPSASVRAGYLVIDNPGDQPLELSGASSPDFGRVEIHEMRHADGMMQMREVKSMRIPARDRVRLQPGGLHLMLMQPGRKTLAIGDQVELQLHLRDPAGAAQTLRIAAEVRAPQP